MPKSDLIRHIKNGFERAGIIGFDEISDGFENVCILLVEEYT